VSDPALRISDLRVGYGGIAAVKGISLEVARGEIVTLIGANGAGKTSTLKAIVGLVAAQSGDVTLFGESLRGVPTHRIAKRGVALVPEGRAIFGNLTVAENLDLGAYLKRENAARAARLERVLKLFPRLSERMAQEAGTLSGGEQQMLAFGRAMMTGPKLLLLDEPSLGLAPLMVAEVMRSVRAFRETGMTVLLVEQNANLALQLADRGYVMETGSVRMQGTGAELLANAHVRASYLGQVRGGGDVV
jgi:branched-chain amino acid transport system ATP-binding protein